jgi:hypothetical protein
MAMGCAATPSLGFVPLRWPCDSGRHCFQVGNVRSSPVPKSGNGARGCARRMLVSDLSPRMLLSFRQGRYVALKIESTLATGSSIGTDINCYSPITYTTSHFSLSWGWRRRRVETETDHFSKLESDVPARARTRARHGDRDGFSRSSWRRLLTANSGYVSPFSVRYWGSLTCC